MVILLEKTAIFPTRPFDVSVVGPYSMGKRQEARIELVENEGTVTLVEVRWSQCVDKEKALRFLQALFVRLVARVKQAEESRQAIIMKVFVQQAVERYFESGLEEVVITLDECPVVEVL